jgi:hypothetical protein
MGNHLLDDSAAPNQTTSRNFSTPLGRRRTSSYLAGEANTALLVVHKFVGDNEKSDDETRLEGVMESLMTQLASLTAGLGSVMEKMSSITVPQLPDADATTVNNEAGQQADTAGSSSGVGAAAVGSGGRGANQ